MQVFSQSGAQNWAMLPAIVPTAASSATNSTSKNVFVHLAAKRTNDKNPERSRKITGSPIIRNAAFASISTHSQAL